MTDDEIKNLIASNAKAIEALTHNVSELERDRKGIYALLGRIARAQADFYATQADFYERFDRLEERQARMTEILDRLDPHDRP
jgi:flagellar capping protein FliD